MPKYANGRCSPTMPWMKPTCRFASVSTGCATVWNSASAVPRLSSSTPGRPAPAANPPQTWSCAPTPTTGRPGSPVAASTSCRTGPSRVPLGRIGGRMSRSSPTMPRISSDQFRAAMSRYSVREASDGSVAASPPSRYATQSPRLSTRRTRSKAARSVSRCHSNFGSVKVGSIGMPAIRNARASPNRSASAAVTASVRRSNQVIALASGAPAASTSTHASPMLAQAMPSTSPPAGTCGASSRSVATTVSNNRSGSYSACPGPSTIVGVGRPTQAIVRPRVSASSARMLWVPMSMPTRKPDCVTRRARFRPPQRPGLSRPVASGPL